MNKKQQTLKYLQELSPKTGMDWDTAREKIADGKTCVRRSSWPIGDFMWCKIASQKYLYKKTKEGVFYYPVTLEYMKKSGWKELNIQAHYNRLRYNSNSIQVGYWPGVKEIQEVDWEIYTP